MTQTLLQQTIDNSKELDNQLFLGLSGSARSYVFSQIFKQNQQTLVYVCANMVQATKMYDDLVTFLSPDVVHLFPMEDSIVADLSIASKDLMARRIATLDFMLSQQKGIIVMPLVALRHFMSPKQLFEQYRLLLSQGNDISLETLTHYLHSMGYSKESIVESPGQFSIRGGIIDIYDVVSDKAYRIELFDTEIDSIREFDVETQKSLKHITQAYILPANDIIFDCKQLLEVSKRVTDFKNKQLKNIKNEEVSQAVDVFFTNLAQRLALGELPEQPKRYIDLFYNKPTSILEYIDERAVVVLDEYTKLNEQEKSQQFEENHWLIQQIEQAIMLPNQMLRQSFKDVLKKDKHRVWYVSHLQKGFGRIKLTQVYSFQYRSMPQFFSQMPLIKTEFERFNKQKMTSVVVVASQKRQDKVAQTFLDFDISNVVTTLDNIVQGSVNIVVGQIHDGFELINEKLVFLNERELFNKVTKTMRKQHNLTNAERLKSYSELSAGDYVVHVSHGVGKYQGMETLDINGVKQDYMSIIYQDDAKLFIPVTQINLVQKYVASDGKEPKLNKLGGSEWAKTKRKVAKKIEDIADELIALYAKREEEVGFAFSKDTPDQKQFEEAFAYAETQDQLRSIQEIKKDMEMPKPMDRLLVGDVGYGKTEVAMRAIFKAVQDGKQVAFLVPTTILAQQHYMTLIQRFEDYPINIGLLSRFKTKKEQLETIEGLKKGSVDIVIGTHRVVSSDVNFKELGLIVIDEEQRFGVKHKERLKQLKTDVDVLTLTATPIPRTLHMSMLGVRDLSVIETPPANRYPVQTYVMGQNDDIIKDGIERELSRGGQVFYLYNRVESIQEKANHIQQLVPDAKIAVAHGQMSEIALENVLMAFMSGEYDVLVTTTIIETGVDLPNVNTLYIEDADRMGLSQLYQLRGRVGRTNRIAYAYFMYKMDKVLTETSEKRLAAIKEFTQLGAGFKIAMRDLSIRGAGNLLGKQQSGFIDSVGFDLYTQMLKEAVSVKKHGKVKKEMTVEIDLGINAYIPNDYIDDERQKIDIYKRIRTIDSIADYRSIQDDLIDRFGDYPDEVSDLVNIGLLKYYAQKQGVEKIKRLNHQIFVTFNKEISQQMSAPVIFEQLAKTSLKANIKNDNGKVVVVFDVYHMATYLWLEQLQKYLAIDKERSSD